MKQWRKTYRSIWLGLGLVFANGCGSNEGLLTQEEDSFAVEEADLTTQGLVGQYFSDANLTTLAFTRTDGTINFTWGGSPKSGFNTDRFSVRWTGFITPRYTETYTFTTTTDDGVRLTINGKKLVDDWSNHAAKSASGTIALVAGKPVPVIYEYYENVGQAVAKLFWSSASQANQIVPASQLSNGNNLLANGSFESNLNGWGNWQGASTRVSLPGAPDGQYVARVAQKAGTTGGFSIDDSAALVSSTTAGVVFTATAFVAAATPSSLGKTVRIALRERGADGSSYKAWESSVVLTNSFQKLSLTTTAERSGDVLDFYLLQSGGAEGDAFYADNLSVVAGNTPAPVTPPAQVADPTPTPAPTPTPTPEPAPAGWKLVFQDDFNGTAVNTANWGMYDSPGHANNGLRKPSAFSVADGLLTVTAQMVNGVLVSGGMAHRSNYTYGRFEFRVRTEADPSGAVSGVVLTWPQSVPWPLGGENDMYETGNGATRSNFHTFIHYGADNRQYHFQHSVDATQWHTVAMEWEANAIRMYRDGALVWTLTDTNAIPHVAHHMTIQLDALKATMGSPSRMVVDWVKIYQR